MAPPEKLVIIEQEGDTSIVVSKTTSHNTDQVQFQVSRDMVGKLKLSADKSEIRLTSSNAASIKTIELLLRCIRKSSMRFLPGEFDLLPIKEIWGALTLVSVKAGQHYRRGRYNVPSSVLRKWFSAWFNNHIKIASQDEYEKLLYPAFAFRDSESFATITKWLAYNAVGQIQDRNPLMEGKSLPHSYDDMHLPEDILDAVNGAPKVLKDRISEQLDQHMRRFQQDPSPCGIRAWGAIIETLLEPLEYMLKQKSVNETLFAVSLMFGGISPEGAENCCICRMLIDIQEEVFEGLCLHCKDIPVNKSEQSNHLSSDICKWHEEMTQRRMSFQS
ncbi:hypothetical protein F5B21DRAFT_355576 [Xylaria acuta]|nr:hypothetical protein F5B21DRAFT_355576 [Xylaria acuta]